MKKIIFALLILVFGLSFIGISYADFFSPWQLTCAASQTAGSGATIIMEPVAEQNIVIDRITAQSDLVGAVLTITTLTRESAAGASVIISGLNSAVTGFSTNETAAVSMKLSITSTATTEPKVFGGTSAEVPLWIGDKGNAVIVRLTGTSYSSIIVNGRRGMMPLPNPSKMKGY